VARAALGAEDNAQRITAAVAGATSITATAACSISGTGGAWQR